ncbi:subunit of the Arp2/3 complex [Allomyces arbusculus]|nr:subunit of the Arp2/3 complex [Allomyces arbusculus]
MPVYHSSFNAVDGAPQLGNMALLPIKSKTRGYAPTPADFAADDIIDEALNLFRANCLFRNFEIQGPADRVLIYLILFISDCLSKLSTTTSRNDASRTLVTLAVGSFAMPGDAGFPLNALYAPPASMVEKENLRAYMTQLRQETVSRLLDRLYSEDESKPSKWWMAFSKRKFMNKSL